MKSASTNFIGFFVTLLTIRGHVLDESYYDSSFYTDLQNSEANRLPLYSNSRTLFSLFQNQVQFEDSEEITEPKPLPVENCRQLDHDLEACKGQPKCFFSCSEELCWPRNQFQFPSDGECQARINHLSCADFCNEDACTCGLHYNAFTHCVFDEYSSKCVSLRLNVSDYALGREILERKGIKNFKPCIRGSHNHPVFYAVGGVTKGSWKSKNIESCQIAEVIFAANFGKHPELGYTDATDNRGITYINSKTIPCDQGGNYNCQHEEHDDLITYGAFTPITTDAGVYYDKLPGVRDNEQTLYGTYIERVFEKNDLETLEYDQLRCIFFPVPLGGKFGAFEICINFADWIPDTGYRAPERFFDIWFGNYMIARSVSHQRLHYRNERLFGGNELCFPVYIYRELDGSSVIAVGGYVRENDEWESYNEKEYNLTFCGTDCPDETFSRNSIYHVVRGWKFSAISVVRYETGDLFAK